MARFTIKEPQEGHRNTHTSENTLRVYLKSIELLSVDIPILRNASSFVTALHVDLGKRLRCQWYESRSGVELW